MIDDCNWMNDEKVTAYDILKAEAMRQAYDELEDEYVREHPKWYHKLKPFVRRKKAVHGSMVVKTWLFGFKWRW